MAVAVGLYLPALRGPFAFDDTLFLQKLDARDVGAALLHLPDSVIGGSRAVTNLTFALNRALFGTGPLSFHVVNLAIHIGCLLALHRLGQQILRRAELDRPWIPVVVATLWAVHPLGSESVAFIWQRCEALSSLCYAAALVLALEPGRRRWIRYGLATFCLLLGLGAKGLPVTGFATLALVLWAFPDVEERPAWRAVLFRAGPWSLAAAGFVAGVLFRDLEPNGIHTFGFDVPDLSAADYWRSQGRVLAGYARMVFLPTGQNVDHDFSVSHGFDAPTLLAALAVAVSAGVAVAALRRGSRAATRVAAFGVLWFIIVLAPSSAFPIVDIFVEHRTYLASWGLIFSAVVAADLALSRIEVRAARVATAVVLLTASFIGYATALSVRAKLWSDEVALWTDSVAKSPNKFRPHVNLAGALRGAGDLKGWILHVRTALSLRGRDRIQEASDAQARIEALLADGRIDEASSLAEQQLTREVQPPEALALLARVRVAAGRAQWGELAARESIWIDPDRAEGQVALGIALAGQNRFDEAIPRLVRGVQLSNRSPSNVRLLANVLAAAGRDAEASAVLESLRVLPEEPAQSPHRKPAVSGER